MTDPNTYYNKGLLKSKLFRVALGIVGVLLIGIFGVQLYVKHKISHLIATELPAHFEMTYADLNLNILLGNVEFEDVKLTKINLETQNTSATISIKTLEVTSISYWALFKNEQFIADDIIVNNAKVKRFKKDAKTLRFSVKDLSFKLSNFVTDRLLLKQKIPFEYAHFNMTLTGLYFDLSRYETLEIAKLSYADTTLEFHDLALSSKWSKSELSKRLLQERDYVNFKVLKGTSANFHVETIQDRFRISADNFVLNTSKLHLFRDKLIADDTSKKSLYGNSLKNLPFSLDIKYFLIADLGVFYSERVDKDIEPVSISFENIAGKIDNISNINTGKTAVAVTAKLMGKAPLQFNWDFKVLDASYGFNASVVLKDLDALTINPFLESQANVRAVGRINEMYFTIHGSNETSTGDMKMKYEDFKFSILNEDQLGINKTLTALVNLITNDGSKTDDNGYRYGEITAERDVTKSFFNYLWLNTKNGLKNTLTGNGEK